MDKVPKDVVELITNKLSAKEFLNYCNSEIGKKFCTNKDIWMRRIVKDFGFLLFGRNKDRVLKEYKENPKYAYLELFTTTSKAAEEISTIIIGSLGESFRPFIKPEYKEYVYNFFFEYLLRGLNLIEVESDIETLATEYFWDNREWRKLFPFLYQEESALDYTWNDEMESAFEKYIVEVLS